jgi:predicted GIY-YIG superfamily endonuclease
MSHAKNASRTTHHASRTYPCWLSRLASHLKVALPNNAIIPLKTLFPSRAACLKVKIRELLDLENRLMMEGTIAAPYTDAQLKDLLQEHFAIETTTRYVAGLRKSMGIPSARIRSQEFWYPLAAPFSGIYPLKADKIHAHVPTSGGIYEIRVHDQAIVYPKGASAILYLGRSKNLKKRLLEHSRRHNKNKILEEYVRKHRLTFRFFIIKDEQRITNDERRLYDLFIATFGAKPAANRVRPG